MLGLRHWKALSVPAPSCNQDSPTQERQQARCRPQALGSGDLPSWCRVRGRLVHFLQVLLVHIHLQHLELLFVFFFL